MGDAWTVVLDGWNPADEGRREAQQERARPAERLDGWGEKYPDVRVERVVSRDRAARVLVEQSGWARLLVVGVPGRDSGGSAVGPVSHAVLARARCPVAVVNPATRVWTP